MEGPNNEKQFTVQIQSAMEHRTEKHAAVKPIEGATASTTLDRVKDTIRHTREMASEKAHVAVEEGKALGITAKQKTNALIASMDRKQDALTQKVSQTTAKAAEFVKHQAGSLQQSMTSDEGSVSPTLTAKL